MPLNVRLLPKVEYYVSSSRNRSKHHNRLLILQHVHARTADNRAALAQATGLTRPTVGDIVSSLLDEGLLIESGRGSSTESGGKRPRLLEFLPTARQVIGVSVGSDRIIGTLTDLNAEPFVHHELPLKPHDATDPLLLMESVINGLVAQLKAELLCIGISTRGVVDSSNGIVQLASRFGWRQLHMAEHFEDIYGVPVYVGNDTELATRARLANHAPDDVRNIVTLIIEDRIEVGFTIGGRAYHHSGDLGQLRPISEDTRAWIDLLGRATLQERANKLRPDYPASTLPEKWSFLDLRYGYTQGDALCMALTDELSKNLAHVFAWVIGLLRPDQIVLGGTVADCGKPLLELAEAHTRQLLPHDLVDNVLFSLETDKTLSLNGAIVLALQNELGILR